MSRETIKKISLWFLTFSLIAAHIFFRSQAHAEELSWKEIQVKAGDCRISFPENPQLIEQKLKLSEGLFLNYDVYLAPIADHSVCLLLIAQYPKPLPAGTERIGLEGLLKGILNQHPDNQLLFSDMIQYQSFPALNFLVQSGKNYFRGQAVMVHNKLYLIAIEGMKERFEEKVFQSFLKSFKIRSQN